MNTTYQAVRLSDRVYWVGAIDWTIRNFHGYLTSRGTTYNAFLVMGERIVLVDTVKHPFKDEMLSRIRSVVDPQKIDVVISNHTEMDHSGCLPEVLDLARPQTLIASAQGAQALKDHYHWSQDTKVIEDEEHLTVGNCGFHFYETRMLHWPDSMFTYLENDRLLFSSDAFGMHLASSNRFDDQLDSGVCMREAAKYYANILLPFSPLVSKLLQKINQLNLAIDIIAPDHGPIYRTQPQRIINHYTSWCRQKPSDKALVVYDTMWQSTSMMAGAIGEGLAGKGLDVKLLHLDASHRSDVAMELLDAGLLVVGSPTLNNQLYPSIADAMTYIKGLRPKNKLGCAFGSYGWSGEAVKHLEQHLTQMGVELAHEGLKIKYVPNSEDLIQCRDLGVRLANRFFEQSTPS